MKLTEQNIAYITKNLELYGLKNQNLKEDILDHICTHIENTKDDNFNRAYETAIQQFGGYLNINQIQRETHSQLYYKSAKNRYKILFIIGFLNSILIATGSLFKIMHWPDAGKILVLAFAFFILITLPLLFYSKYKDKSLKYQS
ncbi:hypothetical protein [uncultured Lacinutrix sp.]|uniref:hypothetical protein n=1 Tax=uncultured Lacinutrix sp. TaxID=574032 RepID=UPI002627A309|nr:hypothetical protein [uncultured Lacinutrix sp.]